MTDTPKNWRAVLAMLVTVGPTFPGLVNSINADVNVGYAIHLFDIAWIYGVSSRNLSRTRYIHTQLPFQVRGRVYGLLYHFRYIPCTGNVCAEAYSG